MNIMGSVSVSEALAAASKGEARSKTMTDFVDTDSTGNGFPGFTSIWNRVWGVAQGILNPEPTVASSNRIDSVQPLASNGMLVPGAVLAGFGILAIAVLKNGKARRSPARRYARIKRSRR